MPSFLCSHLPSSETRQPPLRSPTPCAESKHKHFVVALSLALYGPVLRGIPCVGTLRFRPRRHQLSFHLIFSRLVRVDHFTRATSMMVGFVHLVERADVVWNDARASAVTASEALSAPAHLCIDESTALERNEPYPD